MPATNVHFNIKTRKHILVIFNYFLFKRLYEKAFASSRIKHWKHVSEHVIAELKTEIAGYLNLNKFIYER